MDGDYVGAGPHFACDCGTPVDFSANVKKSEFRPVMDSSML